MRNSDRKPNSVLQACILLLRAAFDPPHQSPHYSLINPSFSFLFIVKVTLHYKNTNVAKVFYATTFKLPCMRFYGSFKHRSIT
jgi:hypothetical protein